MGFNLYLAGGDSVPLELTREDNLGILTTFADGPKAVNRFVEKRKCRIFCDSGAYGAAHSGKKIDLDQYIEFINSTPDVDVWATLDEIPWPLNSETARIAPENTWKNYVHMIENVKEEYRDKILPVYHYGEPVEYINKIIDGVDGYKPTYMAFGGRAGVSTKDLYKFFDDTFFNVIKKSSNPDIKIHEFGVTVFDMLEKYPFHSSDSTTWLRTGIAGNIHTRLFGKVLNISNQRKGHLNSVHHLPKELYDKVIEEIESRGYTLEQLAEDYKVRHIWNCNYYKDWADNFTYKPLKKPVKKALFAMRG